MLPAALVMLLATVAAWGPFEPGCVFRAVSWPIELTGGRAIAVESCSHPFSPDCHHTTWPYMECQARLGPWQPWAVWVSWSSNRKPFTQSCVRRLQRSSAAESVLSYTTSCWGPCWHTGLWSSWQSLHRPCPILCGWCRGRTSPSNGSCIAQGSPIFGQPHLLPISLLLDITEPDVSHIPWWAGFRKTCCSRWFW